MQADIQVLRLGPSDRPWHQRFRKPHLADALSRTASRSCIATSDDIGADDYINANAKEFSAGSVHTNVLKRSTANLGKGLDQVERRRVKDIVTVHTHELVGVELHVDGISLDI
jgi:hypothetical protein